MLTKKRYHLGAGSSCVNAMLRQKNFNKPL
jgi:hypothetical protein